MSSLAGKKVLVTGGAVRVGKVIAETFAKQGAHVAITTRFHLESAHDFAARFEGSGKIGPIIYADFTDNTAGDQVTQVLANEWGRVDIVVHSASMFVRSPTDHMDESHWDAVLGVNLLTPFRLSTACLPLFANAGGGKIIHIVDLSAFRAWPGYLAHSVSKSGLLTLTEGLAAAWAPRNIQVNAVAPGAVLWPEDFSEQQKHREIQKTPAGDSGSPADVANAVLYLAQGSSFLTGACIRVDGGRSLI
ncbi:MAG: SDR family oxidoreductase [Myxococcales bacterium]|nr:SDR family oxidoreductase [Myxococcales bacterium]